MHEILSLGYVSEQRVTNAKQEFRILVVQAGERLRVFRSEPLHQIPLRIGEVTAHDESVAEPDRLRATALRANPDETLTLQTEPVKDIRCIAHQDRLLHEVRNEKEEGTEYDHVRGPEHPDHGMDCHYREEMRIVDSGDRRDLHHAHHHSLDGSRYACSSVRLYISPVEQSPG